MGGYSTLVPYRGRVYGGTTHKSIQGLLTNLPIQYSQVYAGNMNRGVLYGAKGRGVVIFAVWDTIRIHTYGSG